MEHLKIWFLEQVNERGKQPLIDLLTAVGPFPMLEGKNWDETQFDWKKTIQNFRKYISNKTDDIFSGKEITNEVDTVRRKKKFWIDVGSVDWKKVFRGIMGIASSIVTFFSQQFNFVLRLI